MHRPIFEVNGIKVSLVEASWNQPSNPKQALSAIKVEIDLFSNKQSELD